ncbi:MAG: response regulator transcription factor [Anaerolineales bacterium]|nr:response regulator transcription factor [Anaerolineales bacterium]
MTNLRVLIADDSAEFRKSVRMMLAFERDFDVVAVARDGVEALEMARSLQPDVAIMDINMPRMDGLTAIRLMPRVSTSTVCMIMSSEAERDQLRQAMAAGVREYLIKPFTPEEFVAGVRRVAAQATEARQKAAAAEAQQAERDRLLLQLVNSYLKTGRMDDEAAKAYAAYSQRPQADPSLLARLAEIFCARREWRTLRQICERMERLEGGQPRN